MKFEAKSLVSDKSSILFSEVFTDLLASISGLTDSKIQHYFVSKAVGARSKSLASTIRTLVLNDLQLKGWKSNWKPFYGLPNYESAIWNFDAAKHMVIDGKSGWFTVEVSFDNRAAIGTHLVKSQVANNLDFRKVSGGDLILHHCIVSASQSFKNVSGIDSSVASSEEFEIAAKAYSGLGLTPTTLISLSALETLEVQHRKIDGRKKSKLLNLEIS
jgi:hypothetical protein